MNKVIKKISLTIAVLSITFSAWAISLNQAKQQLKGQIAISRESNSSLMLSYAKSLLLHNKINTLANIYQRVDEISSSDILEMSNLHFKMDEFDFLYYNGQ